MPPSLVLAPAWLALAAHMLTMRHPQRRVLRRSHVNSPSKNCWLSDREAAGRQGPQASRFRPTNAGHLDNLIKFKSSSQGTQRMPSSLVFAPAWLAMAVHMLAIRHPRRRFSSAARTSIGSTITSTARPALLPHLIRQQLITEAKRLLVFTAQRIQDNRAGAFFLRRGDRESRAAWCRHGRGRSGQNATEST